MPGPAMPRLIGSSTASAARTSVGAFARAVLAHELLVDELDDDCGSGAALDDFPGFGANQLECVEAFAPDFRRDDLDRHARHIVRKRLSDGLSARVLGDGLLGFRLRLISGRRRRVAEHQSEDRQRELRVVLRQALGLLSEQSALESLVFFLEQPDQFLVFGDGVLELRDALVRTRRVHLDDEQCRAQRNLSSAARQFFCHEVLDASRARPASNRASAAASMCTDREPAPAAGNSNTARCSRL
jgi:hypothetical protein